MVRTTVRRLTLGVVAAVSIATTLFSFSTVSAQETAFKGPDTPVAFILDASRSMLGEVEGRRRMDVARDAMLQLAPGPLQQGRASLVSFGNDAVNECDNIPLIHPFGADSVSETIAAIQTMEPAQPSAGQQSVIGSPLYRSIEVALSTLPEGTENGSIVMVTDGVDACDRDICELVPELQDRGISVDILAIDVNPNLLNLLACVPAGTGGALLPSDNLPTIESYARLLSRAAAPEPVDVQPYLDEIGRLTAELAAMKRERDDLDNLRRQLDADLLQVFGELDAANERIAELEAALADALAAGEDTSALADELAAARITIAQLQDRIVALDAAVKRCEEEKAALEEELRLAALRINELETVEPEVEIREITKIVPDEQVVADLARAKETLIALGCPFENMEACEPAGGGREEAMLAEIERLRALLGDARNKINVMSREQNATLADLASSEKLVQRMIDGLALTASTYEGSAGEGYSWDAAVAENDAAGRGMNSVRANRALMATVSREQQIQIIQSDTSGLQGQVDALTAQLVAAQANLDEANADGVDLRGQLNEALGQRDAALVERDGLARRLEQLVERTNLIGDERDAAVKLSEDRLAEILRLTTALQEQNDRLTVIAGEFNTAEADRETLAAEVDRYTVLLANRDEVIVSLNTEVEGLRAALAQAQAERDEAVGDRNILLEEIAKLDHTVETLLAKNRELQAMMDEVSATAAADRTAATDATSELDVLRSELDIRVTSLTTAQDRVLVLEGELAELRLILDQINGELSDAQNASSAVTEENQSLVIVLNELRDDIVAKEGQVNAASTTINELNIQISELETAALDNEAFFDILITQCTALLGLEGDTGDALDRETLAFECAAAFESAQRWRADLTDMVELRDRSLQACEARYAALDTRAQSLAEGVCPN